METAREQWTAAVATSEQWRRLAMLMEVPRAIRTAAAFGLQVKARRYLESLDAECEA